MVTTVSVNISDQYTKQMTFVEFEIKIKRKRLENKFKKKDYQETSWGKLLNTKNSVKRVTQGVTGYRQID